MLAALKDLIWLHLGSSDLCSDLVIDCCDSNHNDFYMTEHFELPLVVVPPGERHYRLRLIFVHGLSVILQAISNVLYSGGIPNHEQVDAEMERIVDEKVTMRRGTFWDAMFFQDCGGDIYLTLEALWFQTMNDWDEGCLRESVEEDEEYHKLPVCEKHDLDWDAVGRILR